MIIYFKPHCPYCTTLSSLMSNNQSTVFDRIPGVEARPSTHPEYIKDQQKHGYFTVPMLITSSGKNLKGFDANYEKILKVGTQQFLADNP